MQHVHLAQLYARIGYPDAALEEANGVRIASARMLCQIYCLLTAGHQAIDANFTKYTPNAGSADLKRAICDRYRADYGVEYAESEVIVSAGGKQALFNTALALFGPGDEVIIHSPCWPTLPEQIKLAEATPVFSSRKPCV